MEGGVDVEIPSRELLQLPWKKLQSQSGKENQLERLLERVQCQNVEKMQKEEQVWGWEDRNRTGWQMTLDSMDSLQLFFLSLCLSLWFLCSLYLHLNFIMYPTTEQILLHLSETTSMCGIPISNHYNNYTVVGQLTIIKVTGSQGNCLSFVLL